MYFRFILHVSLTAPYQNKRRAFQVLRSRLMDRKIMREIEERRATRLNLVRTADRSEKIRTYNYAQVRTTILVKLLVFD